MQLCWSTTPGLQYRSVFQRPLRHALRRSVEHSPQPLTRTLRLVSGAVFLAVQEHAPISMVGLHERLTNAATNILRDGMHVSK
jgi:hypothetical protein